MDRSLIFGAAVILFCVRDARLLAARPRLFLAFMPLLLAAATGCGMVAERLSESEARELLADIRFWLPAASVHAALSFRSGRRSLLGQAAGLALDHAGTGPLCRDDRSRETGVGGFRRCCGPAARADDGWGLREWRRIARSEPALGQKCLGIPPIRFDRPRQRLAAGAGAVAPGSPLGRPIRRLAGHGPRVGLGSSDLGSIVGLAPRTPSIGRENAVAAVSVAVRPGLSRPTCCRSLSVARCTGGSAGRSFCACLPCWLRSQYLGL